MSSAFAVVRIGCSLALITMGCALCLLGTSAAAQNVNPAKDEVFGGYSVLFPNGYGDLVLPPISPIVFHPHVNTITKGFDVSNTYYFCKSCNFGFLVDGSGHLKGTITPRTTLVELMGALWDTPSGDCSTSIALIYFRPSSAL